MARKRKVTVPLGEQIAAAGLQDDVRQWVEDLGITEAARRLIESGIHTSRRALRRWLDIDEQKAQQELAQATAYTANDLRRAAHAVNELHNLGQTCEDLETIAHLQRSVTNGLLPLPDGGVAVIDTTLDGAKVRLKAAEGLLKTIAQRDALAERHKTADAETSSDPLRAMGEVLRQIHSPHADSQLEREVQRLRAADADTIDVAPEAPDDEPADHAAETDRGIPDEG